MDTVNQFYKAIEELSSGKIFEVRTPGSQFTNSQFDLLEGQQIIIIRIIKIV